MKEKLFHIVCALLGMFAVAACNQKVQDNSGALGFEPGKEPKISETFVPGPVAKGAPTPSPSASATPTPSTPIPPLPESTPTPSPSVGGGGGGGNGGSPVEIPSATPVPPLKTAAGIFNVNVYRSASVEINVAEGAGADRMTYAIAGGDPAFGTVTQPRPGTFIYSATAAMPSGPQNFTFVITDPLSGMSSEGTIKITHKNHPPAALGVVLSLTSNSYSGQLTAGDADNDPLVFQLAASPSFGSAEVAQTGAFYYQASGAPRTDSFTVRVSDNHAGFTDITVQLQANASTAGTTFNLSSLPLEDRNPTMSGQTNFGAGQRSLLRDSQGRQWFVQDGADDDSSAADYSKNDGIRYSLWSEGSQAWIPQRVANMPGYALLRSMVSSGVTEPAAHFMADDYIYSYGKSLLAGYFDECAYKILQNGSCGTITPKTTVGSVDLSGLHYIGAAVSPSRIRVVWMSATSSIAISYRMPIQTANWGALKTSLPCAGFRNGQPRFLNNRMIVVGECVGLAGALDKLMAMDWTIGSASPLFYDLSNLDSSTPNFNQAFPQKIEALPRVTKAFDLLIDPEGGIHILAGTSSGHAVYLFRTGPNAWGAFPTPHFVFSERTNHARFLAEGRSVSILRGTLSTSSEGKVVLTRDKIMREVGQGVPIDIAGASRLNILDVSLPSFGDPLDSVGAIYVESSALQTVTPRARLFLFQSQLSPNGRTIWNFPALNLN